MTETKLEKVLNRIQRVLCDWGMARPTPPKSGDFYGNSAPLWRCPSPMLLVANGIYHLVVFIVELVVASYLEQLGGGCGASISTLRNTVVFFYLFTGVYQFYMSLADTGTDKQWCRYITISTGLETLLLLFCLVLAFNIIDNCKSQDLTSYNIAVSCIILGVIGAGAFSLSIGYIIIKLYCIGNPLAYNKEIV
jgi:hypothetical protein